MSDTLTFYDLIETVKLLKAMRPQYEIWISQHVPAVDLDGEPLGGYIIPAVLNGWRGSILKETEKICLISEDTWTRYEDVIRRSGYPVFRSGGERMC